VSDDELRQRLEDLLAAELGPGVHVEHLTRLPGGASKNTWSFSIRSPEGAEQRFILRAERGGPAGGGIAMEGALLAAAARAGVPVPGVVIDGGRSDALGPRFLIVEYVDGETIPRRILREEALADARAVMAEQCGKILAALHRIPVDEVPQLGDHDVLAQLRGQLDALGQPHPAFELGLRWLAESRPPPRTRVVVHGDFRNGNLIVGPDGIRAVLDWELAHVGDPVEDLGWLCVKAWRFGSDLPVGGFGRLEQLLSAYQQSSGRQVERSELRWWVVYGTLRWGVICIVQTLAHVTGAVRSVELAAIGRRVCEVESDLMDLLPWGSGSPTAPQGPQSMAAGAGRPHDIPSADALLDAVAGYLESDVMAATEGRVRFHARVAANVVAMVARELRLGPGQALAHAERLAGLGVGGEAELSAAIREGALDDRIDAVADVVRATVADKLAVANPAYPTGDTGGFSA
jgi:aminoglycoside phosphotransferase (APT) family kinase protein